jgi:hypothetical protein
MLKFIGWVIGIALFCWATVSALSIFSELKFLVDFSTWSVDQVPISIKAIALAVGKSVSGVVGGYREFIQGLVQMLRLPQLVYDVVGVAAFSIVRGIRIGDEVDWKVLRLAAQIDDEFGMGIEGFGEGQEERLKQFPIKMFSLAVTNLLMPRFLDIYEARGWRVLSVVGDVVVYGGLVAIVVSALFSVDLVYRHFV